MGAAGPELPPSASDKRKREESTSDSDNDSTGPALPPRKRSRSPDSGPKKQRTFGPTLPPAPLHERPPESPERVKHETMKRSDSEEADEDFGPHLPRPGDKSTIDYTTRPVPDQQQESTNQPSRDAWMLVPPSGSDWTSRVDPTKLRSRKFNTNPTSSSNPADKSIPSIWHETPAEKQARLKREVMGIKTTTTPHPSTPTVPQPHQTTHQPLKTQVSQTRGDTLYSTHQNKADREKDDDPSARAFDRDKDIAGGMQINATKRKEMLNKSKQGIGSRFAGAKYL